MLNLTSAAAAVALRTDCWLVLLGVYVFFFQISCKSYMVMDVVQNPVTVFRLPI